MRRALRSIWRGRNIDRLIEVILLSGGCVMRFHGTDSGSRARFVSQSLWVNDALGLSVELVCTSPYREAGTLCYIVDLQDIPNARLSD